MATSDSPFTGPSPQNTDESFSSKASRVFGRLIIDKRRLPASQLQKRGIPAYVGEWVLDTIVPGDGPLLPEEAAKAQEWAGQKIPGPADQGVIKYRLSRGETVKVLTPLQVEIRIRRDKHERLAQLSLLGLEDVLISDDIVARNEDLLRQGMWGVTELVMTSAGVTITSFRPMQASLNLVLFKNARSKFSLQEWKKLILLSMGYRPEAFDEDQQIILLTRLLPLVQKNLHLVELAPKGTGKSYFFENVSPKVRVVSGGNVSPAVLFVNNASGQWGLLARFSTVVLDEVQTLKFQQPEEIIGGLKGYLANGRITRGGLHESASDCGLVMLANIQLDEKQRPVSDILVNELPEFLREPAFLDRLRGIIPGWKAPKLSSKSFADDVGLKSDFFGDVLLALRDELWVDEFVERRLRLIGNRPYKRNEDAIRSNAAGMMKILFPDGEVSDSEFKRYCLEPARELRQILWDQLYALDPEYRQWERTLTCDYFPVD